MNDSDLMKMAGITPEEAQRRQQEAAQKVSEAYEKGYMDVSGRRYRFTKMKFKERRKVFTYLTEIMRDLNRGSFYWMESERFEAIEALVNGSIIYEGPVEGSEGADSTGTVGHTLAKAADNGHWDRHPGDYVGMMVMAMQVIAHPLQAGDRTG